MVEEENELLCLNMNRMMDFLQRKVKFQLREGSVLNLVNKPLTFACCNSSSSCDKLPECGVVDSVEYGKVLIRGEGNSSKVRSRSQCTRSLTARHLCNRLSDSGQCCADTLNCGSHVELYHLSLM
jgi:hypothetical protein